MFYIVSLISISSFFIFLGQAVAEDRFTMVDNFFKASVGQELYVCSYSNSSSVSFANGRISSLKNDTKVQ